MVPAHSSIGTVWVDKRNKSISQVSVRAILLVDNISGNYRTGWHLKKHHDRLREAAPGDYIRYIRTDCLYLSLSGKPVRITEMHPKVCSDI